MSEFSTRAMLDVTLSDKSVRDAKDKLESELGGRSVRASITPAVSDGGRSRGTTGSSVRDLLNTTNELLVSIRDAIEETGFSNSGSNVGVVNNNTVIPGLGGGGGSGSLLKSLGVVSGLSIGGYFLQDQFGEFEPEALLEQQLSPGMSVANTLTGGFAGGAMGLGNILLEQSGDIGEALGLVDDAEKFEQSLIDGSQRAADYWTQRVSSAVSNLSSPSWVSSLLNFQLEHPEWLSRLTSFRLREPEWLSSLRQLLGVGGGGSSTSGSGPRGGTGRASDVPATRIPGQTGMEMSLSVNADSRGFERVVKDALANLENNRAFQTAVENVLRRQFNI